MSDPVEIPDDAANAPEPEREPDSELVDCSVVESPVELSIEPVVDLAPERVVEPVADPVSESVEEPAVEPAVELTTEPTTVAAIEPSDALPDDSENLAEPEIGGEGWSGADIEEAYLKALTAMEEFPPEAEPEEESAEAASENQEAIPTAPDTAVSTKGLPTDASSQAPVDEPVAGLQPTPASAAAVPASGPRLARGTDRPPKSEALEDYTNVSPAQVIEAAMFVGGAPLTARKIMGLLRGSFDTAFVEQTIEDLNSAYQAQARPYEIRHGEGGYRLELRPEYDRLRHRVYGSGPREVRLAQDVLEVLALVAYRQPISQKDVESHGKQNAGNLLRQLLRRDLVSFERGPGGRKDLLYQTTPRFLSVFGIASLEDLPQAEDLAKK